MDQHGIETMVLSLNAPAVQAIPEPDRAADIARRANDFLAEQVQARSDRFQAFAALPMQDPDLTSTSWRSGWSRWTTAVADISEPHSWSLYYSLTAPRVN